MNAERGSRNAELSGSVPRSTFRVPRYLVYTTFAPTIVTRTFA
jgi:hypothetical protein